MTAPKAGTVNSADGSATVGVQADTVHGGVTIYQVAETDPPERKFLVGVRYLRAGVPSEARKLISRAVMEGHANTKSYFYLMLALLSGRTLQHLSPEDLSVLRSARVWVQDRPQDRWTDAIHVINRLLEAAPSTARTDLNVIIKEFDDLGSQQREEVLRNLKVFLAGPHQDWTWKRAFETARRDRRAEYRVDRVWKFFQPHPAGPRVLWPRPVRFRKRDWALLSVATLLTATSGYFLSVAAWDASWPAALGTLLIAFGTGTLVAFAGLHRQHLMRRRRVKEGQISEHNAREPAPDRYEFASGVDRQFRTYFRRYVPDGAERAVWLAETRGIRQTLRNEVVEIYRERDIDAKQVGWLIRFLVSDVKRQWQTGGLYSFRNQLRIPMATRLAFYLGVGVLGAAVSRLVWDALQTRPLPAVLATILLVTGGVPTVRGWSTLVLERRRVAVEKAEANQALTARTEAHQRWAAKLATRPKDQEMAHWLDCDHKALVELGMQHYKLAPHDVIAHAFIEAPPAGPYKRARVPKGPLRYSRYNLLVFILTIDGVRQMAVDLNFETAEFHDRRRINYRYDAVAAVHVTEADDGQKTLELTLVNSHSIKLVVTGPPPRTKELGEDDRTITAVTLDAAGLDNTLHVLEGIAAEGKQWITYERKREQDGLARLIDAVDP
ncbi:hypothetical protein [Actinoplanes friuliensis]|uniref:Uncharacterized protein n=1 Tax=Actinoplanes friuliensis DSM 7358 TaxID=1246995 RepID=U5W290_9ACTN|nr:hypothetical protein [Actinoplanes friuliensis]AGZ43353.1 hypothetical protein AFR_25445 [Actinoplanes friuliensis DSM 7358]